MAGKYQAGQRFPSEAALVQQFGVSRITIGRALRNLVERGMVERVAGSGTYVRRLQKNREGLVFGLLIPDLGHTEIFEPICHGIAGAPESKQHALLWGHTVTDTDSLEAQALEMAEQYVERRVSGVFFAPVEWGARARETNLAVLKQLEEARIPVVLLDRCLMPYPERSRHDLVGIDNRRAGFKAARHLLKCGAPRVSFVAYEGGAPTVDARIAGFREAAPTGQVHRLADITAANVLPLLADAEPGEGFVCANDRTAGEWMRVLLALGYRIPEHLRIVGIDDVEYASLLPVPLTTIHQPCRGIGEAAMAAMIDRLAKPHMLPRDILLESKLVIRSSCGAV